MDVTKLAKMAREGGSLEHLSKGEALEGIELVDDTLDRMADELVRKSAGTLNEAEAYQRALASEEGQELYSLRNDLQAIAT